MRDEKWEKGRMARVWRERERGWKSRKESAGNRRKEKGEKGKKKKMACFLGIDININIKPHKVLLSHPVTIVPYSLHNNTISHYPQTQTNQTQHNLLLSLTFPPSQAPHLHSAKRSLLSSSNTKKKKKQTLLFFFFSWDSRPNQDLHRIAFI